MKKTMKAGRKHVHVPSVVEAAQTALVYKMGQWLQQQPEWPLLFLQDRQTRRRTAQLIATGLTTIPSRAPQAPETKRGPGPRPRLDARPGYRAPCAPALG